MSRTESINKIIEYWQSQMNEAIRQGDVRMVEKSTTELKKWVEKKSEIHTKQRIVDYWKDSLRKAINENNKTQIKHSANMLTYWAVRLKEENGIHHRNN